MRVLSARAIAFTFVLAAVPLLSACTGAVGPTTAPTATASAAPTAAATTAPPTTPPAPPTPSAEPTSPGVTASPASPTDNDIPPGGDPDLARIATGEFPDGWQDVASDQGTCRISVPGDWDTTTLPGTGAKFPDAQAGLSEQPTGVWTDLIATFQQLYFGADKEILLSDDRLFLMRAGPSGADLSYLLAMQNGEQTCVVLAVATGAQREQYRETLHQILYTLAAGG